MAWALREGGTLLAGLKDLPDLLVWGGVGTRMNGNVQTLLGKWGGVIRRQAAAAAAAAAVSAAAETDSGSDTEA